MRNSIGHYYYMLVKCTCMLCYTMYKYMDFRYMKSYSVPAICSDIILKNNNLIVRFSYCTYIGICLFWPLITVAKCLVSLLYL